MKINQFQKDSFLALLRDYGRSLFIFLLGILLTFIYIFFLKKLEWIAILYPYDILFFGLCLSFLFSLYFYQVSNQNAFVQKEVHKRTNEIAKVNAKLKGEIAERELVESDFIEMQLNMLARYETLEQLTKLTFTELKNAIQEVLFHTANVMKIDRVSVWFFEDSDIEDFLICKGVYSTPYSTQFEFLQLMQSDYPTYFQSLNEESYLIVPSVNNESLNHDLKSYLIKYHILTKLDIPIRFEGILLGVLCCEATRHFQEWSLADRHFCQTIADVLALIIEQSKRRNAEKALQESEERLRLINQASIDGIIFINIDKKIISWNFGAEKIFGYKDYEIMGMDLKKILPEEILSVKTFTKPFETKGLHKLGNYFPVELTHTSVSKEEQYFESIIVREITERKEHEKKLIEAMKRATAADKTKTKFLAMISHELRTPLNAILGLTQCMLEGMDGPINLQQKDSLLRVEKSSIHLLELINDLLDIAKIEASKMKLRPSKHNVIEIIQSCIEDLIPQANKKNLKMHSELPNYAIYLKIDKMRIRQVLLNIIGNAIKFTLSGEISIKVENKKHYLEIHIHDTGIGMTNEELSTLFHPFVQADTPVNRQGGGTGLGLVISKKILELQGGSIKMTSQKDVGTQVTIFLPKSKQEGDL